MDNLINAPRNKYAANLISVISYSLSNYFPLLRSGIGAYFRSHDTSGRLYEGQGTYSSLIKKSTQLITCSKWFVFLPCSVLCAFSATSIYREKQIYFWTTQCVNKIALVSVGSVFQRVMQLFRSEKMRFRMHLTETTRKAGIRSASKILVKYSHTKKQQGK